MQVGKRELFAAQPWALRLEACQCGKAGGGPGKRGGDLRFVYSRAPFRLRDRLDIDVPDQRAVGIGVENSNDLVHPRPELHLLRLQRRAGKGLVHIARDRGRLEQAEIAVREGRYAAEGLE